MTAAEYPDPVWSFIQGLPAKARADLNRSERLVVAIHTATRQHGWTVEQLIDRCGRNHGGANNIGAIIMTRLDWCAGNPPPADERPRRLPFCTPECRDNAGWIEDENGRPVRKCPCRSSQPREDVAS